MTLITSLLNLIQELETSEITTRSNSEQKKKKEKKKISLTAAWVAPQVGLLTKDMWKKIEEIASL